MELEPRSFLSGTYGWEGKSLDGREGEKYCGQGLSKDESFHCIAWSDDFVCNALVCFRFLLRDGIFVYLYEGGDFNIYK